MIVSPLLHKMTYTIHQNNSSKYRNSNTTLSIGTLHHYTKYKKSIKVITTFHLHTNLTNLWRIRDAQVVPTIGCQFGNVHERHGYIHLT
jgi:hypothetical protein